MEGVRGWEQVIQEGWLETFHVHWVVVNMKLALCLGVKAVCAIRVVRIFLVRGKNLHVV